MNFNYKIVIFYIVFSFSFAHIHSVVMSSILPIVYIDLGGNGTAYYGIHQFHRFVVLLQNIYWKVTLSDG